VYEVTDVIRVLGCTRLERLGKRSTDEEDDAKSAMGELSLRWRRTIFAWEAEMISHTN